MEQEDERIAALLKLAGPRPAVSRDITNRVRASVHEAWVEETSRSLRRRTIGWTAGIAAAIATIALIDQPTTTTIAPPAAIPQVQIVRGTASITGATVSTPADSFATLDWHGSLRMAADSRLRFIDADSLELQRGAIYFSSEPGSKPVAIHTRFGVVRDIGTQFEVRVDPGALRVRVREGSIALERNGAREQAGAGTELDAAQGGVTRQPVSTTGADWNWVLAAAPPVTLDGNAQRVLSAIAREKGLSLVFSDRDLADRVARTSLHDHVPLTPDEALDAATVAADLSYRVSGTTLMIGRRQAR